MLNKTAAKFTFFIICLFALHVKAAEPMPEVLYSPKNSYTIINLIGEGAFGKVYAAKDTSGTVYAIKCYKNISDKRSFYLDPKREYDIGRELNHANIIRSYEYFSGLTPKGKTVQYLVLQYVDGKQLYRLPKKCMKVKEVLNAFDQLLSALIHAISYDRIYLDLHYGNLMLNKSYELMMIDLASFFTFDEIHEYFSTRVVKKGFSNTEGKQIKDLKIEQFFSKNAELFEKMQEIYENEALSEVKMKRKARDRLLLSYLTYYFDKITDACVQIILRSDLDRNSKINFRTKIKRSAWSYEEDVDEEVDQPILHYLHELKQLSKPFFHPRARY